MDSEKRKKIIIIASIIGGSVIVLVTCVWILVAAISQGQNTPTVIDQTPSENVSQTPSDSPATATPSADNTINNTTSQQSTPPATTPPQSTPPVTTAIKTPTPVATPTPSPTDSPNVPKISSMVKTTQVYYNESNNTTKIEINFKIDKNGKVYIIAVDASKNLSLTSKQVKDMAIFGDSKLSNPEARVYKQVKANDDDNDTFSMIIGAETVRIYIVLEAENGDTVLKPIDNVTYTPVQPPYIEGGVNVSISDNKLIIKASLTKEGYINALVVKDVDKIGSVEDIIIAAQNPGNYNEVLFAGRNSKKFEANTAYELTLNIPDNIKMKDLIECELILLLEAPGEIYNLNYDTIKLSEVVPKTAPATIDVE